MKKLFVILLGALMLVACSEEAAEEPKEVEATEETSDEPTQEELNAQLKEEAVEINFVSANADEVEEGTKVKATGEISALTNETLVEFMLSSEEGDGYGVYNVKGFNTTDTPIEEGQTVTVYGSYAGKNDSGMPEISVTIIE